MSPKESKSSKKVSDSLKPEYANMSPPIELLPTAPLRAVLAVIESAPEMVKLHLSAGIDRGMALESAAAATIQVMPSDLDADQRSTVLAAVSRVGIWDGVLSKRIEDAIGRTNPLGSDGGKGTSYLCPAAPGDQSPQLPSRRGCSSGSRLQRMLFFDQAMTQKEWDGLQSSAMQCAKIEQVAHRAWTLGLTNPSEPTTFKIAAIICLVEGISDSTKAERVHSDVKKAIKKLSTTPHPCHPDEYIVDYGADISGLPPGILNFAYAGGTETPIKTMLPGLDSVMGTAKMRVGRNRSTKSQQAASGSSGADVITMLSGLFKASEAMHASTSSVGHVGGVVVQGQVAQPTVSALCPAKDASSWVFKPTLPQADMSTTPTVAPTMADVTPRMRLIGKGPLTRDLVGRAKAINSARAAGNKDSVSDVLQLMGQLAAARKQAKADAVRAAGTAVAAVALQGAANIAARGRGHSKGDAKGKGKCSGGSVGRGRGKKRGRGAKTRVQEIPTLPSRSGIPRVATEGKPVEYNGGKIYFSKGYFRCIRVAGQYATEKKLRVGRYASVKQAWLHALKCIDDY